LSSRNVITHDSDEIYICHHVT